MISAVTIPVEVPSTRNMGIDRPKAKPSVDALFKRDKAKIKSNWKTAVGKYDDLNRTQLLELLEKRDRERKLGLVWERDEIEKLKMHSPDLTQDNIAKIRALFPGCLT